MVSWPRVCFFVDIREGTFCFYGRGAGSYFCFSGTKVQFSGKISHFSLFSAPKWPRFSSLISIFGPKARQKQPRIYAKFWRVRVFVDSDPCSDPISGPTEQEVGSEPVYPHKNTRTRTHPEVPDPKLELISSRAHVRTSSSICFRQRQLDFDWNYCHFVSSTFGCIQYRNIHVGVRKCVDFGTTSPVWICWNAHQANLKAHSRTYCCCNAKY